jgi:glucuronate isomerase
VQKSGIRVRIDAVSILHKDRLLPSESTTRDVARRLYQQVRDLPIISPHGHTEARWFAENEPFPNPTSLFIVPDHYVFRMLYSQGIAMEDLGLGKKDLDADEARAIWIRFAKSYYLFRGTPTRIWLDHAFQELFGFEERLCAANAEAYYDTISAKLTSPAFRPRALYDQFNI